MRGVVGTFHKVSDKYLPLYVAEFQIRDNNRKNDDFSALPKPGAEARALGRTPGTEEKPSAV
jgi:hypothetical protein